MMQTKKINLENCNSRISAQTSLGYNRKGVLYIWSKHQLQQEVAKRMAAYVLW